MKNLKKILVFSALIIAISMLFSISSFAEDDYVINMIMVRDTGRTQEIIDQHSFDPNSLGHHAQIDFYMSEQLPDNWFEIMQDYIVFDGNTEFLNGGFHGEQGENGYLYILMAGSYEVNDPITIEVLTGFGAETNTGVYQSPKLAQSVFEKQ